MDPKTTELNTLLNERQRLQGESEKLAERDRAAREQIAGAEREGNEANAVIAQYNSDVAEAIAAGNPAPEPPTSLRTAAAKIATTETKIAALRAAIKHLEDGHRALVEQLTAVEAVILVERAKLVGVAYLQHHGTMRKLTDDLAVAEGIAGELSRALHAADLRVGGDVMATAEAERVKWLRERGGPIHQSVVQRSAEILAKIPS